MRPLRARIAPAIVLVLLVARCAGAAELRGQLERGADKARALAALRELGVERLWLDVHPAASVSSVDEIANLRECEGIRIVLPAGGIRIGFEGDTVAYVRVAPSLPEYHSRLARVATRADVLEVFRSLLEERRNLSIRCAAFDDRIVSVEAAGAFELALLERYDEWRGYYEAWIGYWHVTLHFRAGRVSEVRRDWLPGLK